MRTRFHHVDVRGRELTVGTAHYEGCVAIPPTAVWGMAFQTPAFLPQGAGQFKVKFISYSENKSPFHPPRRASIQI